MTASAKPGHAGFASPRAGNRGHREQDLQGEVPPGSRLGYGVRITGTTLRTGSVGDSPADASSSITSSEPICSSGTS